MASNPENKHMVSRIDKIEKDLSRLVSLMSDETADRRVFEERMTNAITAMANFQKEVAGLSEKQHSLELFLARDVATVADRTKLHERIDQVENSQQQNTWVIDGSKHFVWLIIASVMTYIGYLIRGG